MPPFDNLERQPHGAVQETEQYIRDVPLPRKSQGSALRVPAIATQEGAPEPDYDYSLDTKATNPLASLPPDVQEKVHRAKMWYEIAAHPGATDFERRLADAHISEMEPDELREQRLAEEEAARKETKPEDSKDSKKKDNQKDK